MSRMTIALIFACCSSAVHAEPVRDGDILKPLTLTGCPRGDNPDEVVVCGSRDGADPHRLPLPVVPTPGARNGEPASAMAAMEVGSDPCAPVGPQPKCNGGLPVIPMILTAIQVVQALAEPDD